MRYILFIILFIIIISCTKTNVHNKNHHIFNNQVDSLTKTTIDIGNRDIKNLYAIVFDNNYLKRLSSFQKFSITDKVINVSTSFGKKILVLIANTKFTINDWSKIYSFPQLSKMYIDLKDEEIDNPTYISIVKITPNLDKLNISLIPLIYRFRIEQLNIDLKNQLNGENLTSLKIYITNACKYRPLYYDDNHKPFEYYNLDSLNMKDMSIKNLRQMLFYQHQDKIKYGTNYIGHDFYFYYNPNISDEGGNKTTKLVVELSTNKGKYYYPIPLKPSSIEFDYYIKLNLSITQLGNDNPIEGMSNIDKNFNLIINKWDENKEHIIDF